MNYDKLIKRVESHGGTVTFCKGCNKKNSQYAFINWGQVNVTFDKGIIVDCFGPEYLVKKFLLDIGGPFNARIDLSGCIHEGKLP